MRKVYGKSIILGIGIGMIITAIAGMIFTAGTQKELSKEEIIRLAKGYGLIEPAKILNGDTASSSSNTDAATTTVGNVVTNSTATENNSSNSTAEENTRAAVDDNNKRNIVIEIKDGYKSQDIVDLLLENKVISSREDFNSVLYSYKASTKIQKGTYKFKKNEDLNYIVKTICSLE